MAAFEDKWLRNVVWRGGWGRDSQCVVSLLETRYSSYNKKRLGCSSATHRELDLQRRSICRRGESHKSSQHPGTSTTVYFSFFLMACKRY